MQEVEGARLRDEYLQRMVGFFVFFFAFSFPRIFSFPFASHTAHVRPISLLESLYAPSHFLPSLSFFTCISLSLSVFLLSLRAFPFLFLSLSPF